MIFFTFIKMSKGSSAKFYQDNKERLQKKKFVKDIEFFLEKKKKKRDNMAVINTKICQKKKKKNWLSIEQNIIKRITLL